MTTNINCLKCIIASVLIHVSIVLFMIIFLTVVSTSPFKTKFDITNVSLMQFNLTNNNTLYYNFRVNVTSRNSKSNGEIQYRRITAIAWYKDNAFAWVSLRPFNQGKKNTTLLGPIVLEGNYVMNLKPKQLDEYNEETRMGIYNDFAMDLELEIRAKFGGIKSTRLPLV